MLDNFRREGDEPVFSELGFFDIEGAVVFAVVVMLQPKGFGESHAALGKEKNGGVDREIVEEVFGMMPDLSVNGAEHAFCPRRRKDKRNESVFPLEGKILEGVILQDLDSDEIVKETPCGNDDGVDGSGFECQRSFEIHKVERVEILYIETRLFDKPIEGPQHASEVLICEPKIAPIINVCIQLLCDGAFKWFH